MMVHWFKKHPKFLETESKALSNNGNYKELLQKRDNFFVSHGYILVRYNGLHKHPVLIFYLNSTPYSIPEVYPLSRELTEAEVVAIALEGQGKIPQDAIKQYYEYRHQNGSGLLCILEHDNLDSGSEFYNIDTIINRVRDWYKGHITREFPPDSEEVDLAAHFNNLNTQLRFIYPADFLSQEVIEGDFLGVSVHTDRGNEEQPRGTYWGARLTGCNENNIFIDRDADIHKYLASAGFEKATDFQTKKQLLDTHIKNGDFLSGYWFEVNAEPKPFKTFEQLVTIIGNGSKEDGLKRLAKHCANTLKTVPKTLVFAIRYKNRKNNSEFQVFTVHKIAQSTPVTLFEGDEEIIKTAVVNYEEVKAVKCEKFTADSYFQRNGKKVDQTLLSEQVINIIGVGAIGSEVADIINKAGVGYINLIDNQFQAAHNAVRHLAGINSMGIPKVHAVKTILESHNVFNSVRTFIDNIKTLEVGLALPDHSISISSIADDNTEGFLNEQAVIYGRTVYYIRAIRGGKAARIFRVKPGKDACFYCLQLHREDDQYFVDIPASQDYPTLRNECNNPIRPASAADLKLIAALSSGLVLNQLQEDSDINHWIWSTEIITGTPIDTAYKMYPQTIPVHAACPYCNDHKPMAVTIDEKVLNDMKQQVANKKGTETGGVLVGYIDNQVCHITHASGAGPKAVEKRNGFEKDIEYCQAFIDELYAKHDNKAVYVGEWHSHPNQDNRPSGIDLNSLNNIAMQKNYLLEKPVMIIFSSEGEPSCTVHPAGKLFYNVPLTINSNVE
ncbi:MAG: ThiF family adenylyltransferase [Bacteroidetes bacterium]|nr:ThiF family adenylyltransferase [Bacteroidota bacterium]